MADELLLYTESLSKSIQDGGCSRYILDHIDLSLAKGQWHVLVGPSGSGKSTLLHVLATLDHHYQGEVVIASQRLQHMCESERARFRREHIGFVFQRFNLVRHLNVLDNVTLASRFASTSVDVCRARELLEQVGLAGYEARLPATLSGGEEQRVGIARALYLAPPLLLLDEPTGQLDTQAALRVRQVLEGLVESGVTMLMATHDQAMIDRASHTHYIKDGVLA